MEKEKQMIQMLQKTLKDKGYSVKTKIEASESKFNSDKIKFAPDLFTYNKNNEVTGIYEVFLGDEISKELLDKWREQSLLGVDFYLVIPDEIFNAVFSKIQENKIKVTGYYSFKAMKKS